MVAQFRTCLWLRAGRWASGQEAGQPPGLEAPHPDRRSEATGLHSFSASGRGLKQRRSGLFWSHADPPKVGLPKRLVLLAGRADEDFSHPLRGLLERVSPTQRSSRYGAPPDLSSTCRRGAPVRLEALPPLASPSRDRSIRTRKAGRVSLFITGTDTGVGKTYTAARLLNRVTNSIA